MANPAKTLLAVSLGFGVASVSLATDAAPTGPRWGTYQNVSVDESSRVIDDAVDKVTADMRFILRGVARRRLKEVNPAYEHIVLSEHDGMITTDFEGRRYVAASNGKVQRNIDPDGSEVDVTYQVEKSALHARYRAKDGEKAIDFAFGPDGHSMELRVQVKSPRLPRPLTYVLKYNDS